MKNFKLQLNTIFDYIKDIRRYSYTFEEHLKEVFEGSSFTVNSVPPVPDEVEPNIARYLCTIKKDNYSLNVELSQVKLSITIEYINHDFAELDTTIEYFNSITEKIKEFLMGHIKNINILYEGIILISESIEKDISDVTLLNLDETYEEKAEKFVKRLDDDFILINDKRVVHIFDSQGIIPLLNRNTENNYVGILEVNIVEINNRPKYNKEDTVKNNIIDITSVKNILIKGLTNGY